MYRPLLLTKKWTIQLCHYNGIFQNYGLLKSLTNILKKAFLNIMSRVRRVFAGFLVHRSAAESFKK
jgi:hypothetical protein